MTHLIDNATMANATDEDLMEIVANSTQELLKRVRIALLQTWTVDDYREMIVPWTVCDLSTRTITALREMLFEDTEYPRGTPITEQMAVSLLETKRPVDLLRRPNLGRKTLDEMRLFVKSHGTTLSRDNAEIRI